MGQDDQVGVVGDTEPGLLRLIVPEPGQQVGPEQPGLISGPVRKRNVLG